MDMSLANRAVCAVNVSVCDIEAMRPPWIMT
jgi:hypothetical protein